MFLGTNVLTIVILLGGGRVVVLSDITGGNNTPVLKVFFTVKSWVLFRVAITSDLIRNLGVR